MVVPNDPTTLGSQFTSLTQNIMSFLSTQVGATNGWQNIAGNLTLIQSSSAGYVWGVGPDNSIYYCKQPCTGNWVAVEMSTLRNTVSENITSIESLQVDESFAYILFKTPYKAGVAKTVINGTGPWSVLMNDALTNGDLHSLAVSNSFIWVGGRTTTGASITSRCAKPCTTKAWITTPFPTDLAGLASDGSNIYTVGFNPTIGHNVVLSISESGNIGSQTMSGVEGLAAIDVATINAQNAGKGLLVTDKTGSMFSCDLPCKLASNVRPVDTNGRKAMSTDNTVSSINNQTWMVSPNNGDKGNIFSRVDNVDSAALLRSLDDLEGQREAVTQNLKNEYNTQTAQIASTLTVSQTVNSLEDAMDIGDKAKEAIDNQAKLETQIKHHAKNRNSFDTKLYPVQILTLFVIISVIVYLFFAILSANIAKIASAGILTLGLGVTIYFSVTNNTYGKSFIQSFLPSP